MKKLFYVAYSSIPSSLPSSLQIIKTCENFSKNKFNVTLLKPGTGNKKLSIKKYYDLKYLVNIKEFPSIKSFPQGLNFYIYSFYCLFFILRNGTSITVTRNYFFCYLLVIFKKKVILEIHHDTNVEGRITKLILNYSNFLNNSNLINIVAITKSVKNLFIKKYDVNLNKITVLPSGSSIKIYKLPIISNKKRLCVGYFGSISPSKGINTLINLSKIDQENDYFIYGGNKREVFKIRKTIKNKNLFLETNIPYSNIPKVMSKMDILVIPYTKNIKSSGEVDDISKYTSPLKLFDYLAVGKIIISSDLKVLREVIDHKNAYFIKNYENIFEWKRNIIKAKNNRQKIFIMSKNNLKLSKDYDHKNRVKKYL